jgi:putative acetyltransferase
MFTLKRTTGTDDDFKLLITLLDKDLEVRNGDEQSFYTQFNSVDKIQNVIVAYDGEFPVGCGAFKKFEDTALEVKRMFVRPEYRGKGIAFSILNELEKWGEDLNFYKFVLETGNKQQEAVRLYLRSGYHITPNYGQYVGVENSICMMKVIGEL